MTDKKDIPLVDALDKKAIDDVVPQGSFNRFLDWAKNNPAVLTLVLIILGVAGLLYTSLRSVDNHISTVAGNVDALSRNTDENFREVRKSISLVQDDVSDMKVDIAKIETKLAREDNDGAVLASVDEDEH